MTQAAPSDDAESVSQRVERAWEQSQELGELTFDESVLARAADLLEELAGLLAAGWDLARDFSGLLTMAQVLLLLDQASAGNRLEAAGARLISASQTHSAEKLPECDGERIDAVSAPGTAWTAMVEGLLITAEGLQRPILLDAALVAGRRGAGDPDLTETDRPIAVMNFALAAISVYARDGTPETRVELVEAIADAPESSPEQATVSLLAAEAMLAWGETTADLATHVTAEEIVLLALAGRPSTPERIRLLLLLCALRCHRAVLADPELATTPAPPELDRPASPEDDAEAALLVGYQEMAVAMPRAVEAALANTGISPAMATVADLAEEAGAIHWQRFRAARLATAPGAGTDQTADMEIVTIAYEGEERIDIAFRLPSDPAAEAELNAAAAMYSLATAQRPDVVPEEIATPCTSITELGDGLASMAAERAIALLDGNEREPDPGAVRTAIGKLTRAATSPHVSAGWRDILAALLGDALIRAYLVDGDTAVLDRAIAILRRGANCGREFRGRSRRKLAEALDQRRILGDEDALEEMVAELRKLVADVDVESGDRLNLASALSNRVHSDAGDRDRDRDEIIDLLREVADLEDDQQRTAHSMLADALTDRYKASEDLADLLEATEHDRAALALATPGSAEHRTALGEVAKGLHTEFEHTSDLAVLDEALSVSTRACEGLDPSRALDVIVLLNHSSVAASMSEETGEAGALTATVPLLREAVAAQAEKPHLQVCLNDKIAMVLHQLWSVGEPADLEEALDASRRSVELAPADLDHAGFVGNLGYLLLAVYTLRQERDLLDECIASLRQAVELARDQPINLRFAQLNLAAGLLRRGTDRGDTAALREAADLSRAVADSSPPTRSEYPIVLSTLGSTLTLLYKKTSEADLLEEAVRVLRRSVELSDGHHQHERHLLNLGRALNTLSEVRQDPALREQSLELSAAAMALIPSGHPQRPWLQLAHAELLLAQEPGPGGGEAAQEAVGLLLDILESETSGQVLAGALREIGDLGIRAAFARDDRELESKAIPYLRAAAKMTTAGGRLRAGAARSWGLAAIRTGEFADALEAFELATEIVSSAAATDLEPADQESWLGAFRGTARLAAACAIELGKPELAVELLERGRGVLLGRTLAARQQIRQLRKVAPELGEALERIEAATADLASSPQEAADPIAISARNTRRAQLEDERQLLLAEIHRLPGLSELGLPPRMESLRAAAAAGPAVIVNVCALRCDALLIDRDGVRVLPLPGLDEARLADRSELFVGAMEILGRDDAVELSLALAARRIVFTTLAWLWDAVAEPVLGTLGITDSSAQPPRIWWCPTGDLSFLPLHAAGRYWANGRSETVLDRVVSSYAPTLRSLVDAAETGEIDDEAAVMVAVSESRHVEGLPVLDVERDIDAFTALFPTGKVLRNEEATAERVLAALREATILHIASHAHQDPSNPSAGCVDLWDRQVSVAELRGAIGKPGRLAMLLGCETARGGRGLADESISLVSALQHAGFRHGVGTMWPIDDGDAERAARAVRGAEAPAEAVASTVRALREELPMAPNRWAGLIHVGP